MQYSYSDEISAEHYNVDHDTNSAKLDFSQLDRLDRNLNDLTAFRFYFVKCWSFIILFAFLVLFSKVSNHNLKICLCVPELPKRKGHNTFN